MERLTIKQDGEYYMKTLNDDCIVCASCEKCEKHINQLVKILGAYEDTGLTPEIVMEYKKFEDELVLKHNIRFNEAIERIEKYPQLQKENAELKKEVKLWEQGREAIANQAKLVEKISFENSKKHFEEKAENAKLKERLESVLNVVSKFMLYSQDINCVMCENPMKNMPFIRRDGEIYGCDGKCNVPNYTIDDVKKLILTHADKLKELGVEV